MGCGVQDGPRAHITQHSLVGWPLRRAALRLCLWGSLSSLLPAAAAAAAPVMAGTVPSQDTHFLVRIQMTTHLVSNRRATPAGARLAGESAPAWTRTSGACCGLHRCLPRVMGCGCRVVNGFFSSHQTWATSSHPFMWWNNTTET